LLLRQVYEAAAIPPDQVVYVEAHGTGTQAGDPAECRALGRVLGAGRANGPLPIGSVKTNLGHLEPASGMPGLFKALLVLRHRMIPASLHADVLNPAIDFDGLGLSVVTRARPLGEVGDRPVAGVNSFGFGGANVHVALAASGSPAASAGGDVAPAAGALPTGVLPVVVSARSPGALSAAVERYAHHLRSVGEGDFYDVAYTACRRRSLHRHRAVVLAGSPGAASQALSALLAADDLSPGEGRDEARSPDARAETTPPDAVIGEAVERGRVALVFCGNGSQWAGMGADLLADPESARRRHRLQW
jgi:acyl transferase domain-containing protein